MDECWSGGPRSASGRHDAEGRAQYPADTQVKTAGPLDFGRLDGRWLGGAPRESSLWIRHCEVQVVTE
jgi:hypothetical protein